MQEEVLGRLVSVPALTYGDKTLTPAGEALLAVLVEPACRELTITQMCAKAGVSRDTYYRLFKDQRFIAAYLDACKVTALAAAMPSMQAIAARAIAGDIPAAQTILQMAGLHVPTASLHVTQTVDVGPSLRELLDARKAD